MAPQTSPQSGQQHRGKKQRLSDGSADPTMADNGGGDDGCRCRPRTTEDRVWDLTTRLESAQAAAARHKAGKREAQAQAAQLEEENEQLVQRVRHLEDELAAEMQQRDDALIDLKLAPEERQRAALLKIRLAVVERKLAAQRGMAAKMRQQLKAAAEEQHKLRADLEEAKQEAQAAPAQQQLFLEAAQRSAAEQERRAAEQQRRAEVAEAAKQAAESKLAPMRQRLAAKENEASQLAARVKGLTQVALQQTMLAAAKTMESAQLWLHLQYACTVGIQLQAKLQQAEGRAAAAAPQQQQAQQARHVAQREAGDKQKAA
ncbi:hypothetical protein COHA_006310 [Chlorella ohadii]|uniref:Uncharacterized protein n=1 Tax=Chlorella ohadii TaxID=2649997 RepID=A0AAD5H0X4_9CHLO|nr:hypothetical protein COHA_006310 [Chlorella ohadii]